MVLKLCQIALITRRMDKRLALTVVALSVVAVKRMARLEMMVCGLLQKKDGLLAARLVVVALKPETYGALSQAQAIVLVSLHVVNTEISQFELVPVICKLVLTRHLQLLAMNGILSKNGVAALSSVLMRLRSLVLLTPRMHSQSHLVQALRSVMWLVVILKARPTSMKTCVTWPLSQQFQVVPAHAIEYLLSNPC
jgi:hypothetical protein